MADRLERLRDRAHKQLVAILQFAQNISPTTTRAAIKTRYEMLETKYQQFNEFEGQLFETPAYVSIGDTVDEVYYNARALFKEAIDDQVTEGSDKIVDLNATLGQFIDQQRTFYEGVNISQNTRLPKINIESFSGDYKQWASFHDLFCTTVHNNSNISGVHKLQMLKGLLTGDAAALIRHIPVTENNYMEAWDKLNTRYAKTTPIVTSLIQSFMDQKPYSNGSGKELRRITETADEIIRGLRALGANAEERDPWLIHILLTKVDNDTRQLWAIESVDKEFPTFGNLLTFLNKRCDALEICEVPSKRVSVRPAMKAFITSNYNNQFKCIACGQKHQMFRCPVFKNYGVEARSKLASEKNLCRNCLKMGHTSTQCYSKASCMICQARHHTLLHSNRTEHQSASGSNSTTHHVTVSELQHRSSTNDAESAEQLPTVKNPNIEVKEKQNTTNVFHTLYSTPTTVLPTAIINITTRTGQLQPFRALLDSGSQSSFVTENCAQRLGIKRSQSSIGIYGLASTAAGITKGKINMTIYSRLNNNYKLNVTAHVIHNITNYLPVNQLSVHDKISTFELADPLFYKPNKIDVLLGADVFFEILEPERHIMEGYPILQSSKFGWLVAGTHGNQESTLINFHASTDPLIKTEGDEDLHQLLQKFWEVEEVTKPNNQATATNSCESFYDQTTERDVEGRFVVRLPFKESRLQLGNSYSAAYQRLLSMERKLHKEPELSAPYKHFMEEYHSLNHMTNIEWNQVPNDDNAKYFLPHHAVIKPSSSTTQLRVVFDASCKTSTQVSLNDILKVGPNIQTDLATILLRFRRHPIALVADIEKMYRQIRVNDCDTNYQLILWRQTPQDSVKVYKLDTVTYGTACAPFLAVRSLKQSTQSFEEVYPTATQIIKNDFYIDDLLTGCNNIKEAIQLKDQLNRILSSSGFSLRKWKSNSEEFLHSFTVSEIDTIPKLIEQDKSIKTLGVIWNSKDDTFSFKAQPYSDKIKWTKRTILSTASKVYDPMGWLSPTIMFFKLLLQRIWLLKVDWDENLPKEIITAWLNIYQALQELEAIQIPRCIDSTGRVSNFQLHAFCDASEAAYGTVIYIRTINNQEEVTTNIIYAKGKVAPINQISLPRLELCGAVLLSKAVKFCLESLDLNNIDVFAWTDSMIVLHWLSDYPRRWKSFVGNRTSAILETIPRTKWQHVDSKNNPADIISRGAKPKILSTSSLWWRGPHWLSAHENLWPKPKSPIQPTSAQLEERPNFMNVLTEIRDDDVITKLITKCSSWNKIRRIVAYVRRFGRRKQGAQQTQSSETICPSEMYDAEKLILRGVQKFSFATELSQLAKKQPIHFKNPLASLDPFVDADGLLRVGGRLRNSSLAYSTKHPVILPKDHDICSIIVKDIHTNHMHAGNTLTLNILRNKYWLIGARYTIKRCIKSCVVCIRYRRHQTEQKMADLPDMRCTQSRPFTLVGLDYAGPLYIKSSKRKTSPIEKSYVAVFVCLAIKAVHLEVVSGLDTESFLAALKRFIARRGMPEQIFCDNGTNFVGANNELQTLKKQIINQTTNPLISEFLLQKNIMFNFNPARAPHFGGLWEASVKSFKYHLKRVVNTGLTFEELTTLTSQIESLLNSRPLCKLNDDPSDLDALTPAHFLVGGPLTSIPEPQLADIPENRLSRWQNVQRRVQGFWTRWHRDYLTSLQQRHKWKRAIHQYQVDDVVLVREDNLHPSQWILARITAVHPGNDGIVRVATLQTSKGTFKRPAIKLVPLLIK